MKPQFFILFLIWPLAMAWSARGAAPNIVIILADDQGWGDLSVNGNKNLSTPNIDSLARDGAILERFFVCPVCSPTRAEFMTGRYYARSGVRGTSIGEERMNLDEKTIAESFKAAGYATGIFGKWHNGSQHPYHPNARGFDEFYGITSGHWGHYFDPILEHNNELIRDKGYIADLFTDKAIGFIESNKEKPFFCYLPFNTPHSPMQVPDEYWNRFAEKPITMHHQNPEQEEMPHLRAALAMCENIDWNVGRLLARLDKLKLAENTIVIYFSDNGPNGWRWNGGMKGRKGAIDEGGVRVPFLIRWPGQIAPGRKIPKIAGAIDLLPTLADLAEVKILSTKPLDGTSLKPLLLSEETEDSWPDRVLFSMGTPGKKGKLQISARNQRFRLDTAGKLYELATDPGQEIDVAAKHPRVVTELTSATEAFSTEVEPIFVGPDDRPYPVGYAATTQLSARDGKPQGGVVRSAKAPNCSYFTNWTTREGAMTWDIEVAEAGDFEAIIHYTCAAGDQGSTIELSFQGEKLATKIGEPHDPTLYGMEADRTPNRGPESYVKDFKPLSIGKIRLAKGRGPLTLRATEIPGKSVADVRWVMLKRK